MRQYIIKVINWLNDKAVKFLDGIQDATVRYITISTINKNPKLTAELYFDKYKNDREALDHILWLIVKHQEHIKYYNYRVFMNRITELTK